ncbi:MAG: disulfide bond formation protein B [Neisseria sp.]|nr:disulfide bond formation protein B [Neisseria sp.]
MMTNQRLALIVALLAAAATATSFFAQYVLLLNPCPLCILQRVAVIGTLLVALFCLCLPKRTPAFLARILMSVPAVWGLAVAVYQLWLQALPAGERPSCGAPWTFRLRDYPLFEHWEFVVRGFGDCGVKEYLLGLSLPTWSVLMFGCILLIVWGSALMKDKH